MNKLSRGLIQVYTGEGKGKTTAALGLALRALGQGLSVYIIQFLKKWSPSGEIRALKRFPNLYIKRFGSGKFVDIKNPNPKDIKIAQEGFEYAKQIITSGKYDLVILDEVNLIVAWKFINVDKLLKLIQRRPVHVELVLTGRHAHPKIIAKADLVTEMKKIKHYIDKKILARRWQVPLKLDTQSFLWYPKRNN